MVIVKVSACGTYSIVPSMFRSSHTCLTIAIRNLWSICTFRRSNPSLTVRSHRGIHLLVALTEDSRQRELVFPDILSPNNVMLICVEQVTHLTTLHIIYTDNGTICHIVCPPRSDSKVIVASTSLTGSIILARTELHVLGGIKRFELTATIATKGRAILICLKLPVIDSNTILNIGTFVRPTYNATTFLTIDAIDNNTGHTVGDERTLQCISGNTCMRSIACHSRSNIHL